MKIKTLIIILMLILISILLGQNNQVKSVEDEKVPILVFPVTYSSKEYQKFAEFVYTLLEESLVKVGKFQVIPRGNIEKIIQERNMIDLGIVDAKNVSEIGKLLGSKYAITINITNIFAKVVREVRFLYIFKLYEEWDATVSLNLKVFDVTTGELLADKQIKAETVDIQQLSGIFDYMVGSIIPFLGKSLYPRNSEDAVKQAFYNSVYRIELALKEFFPTAFVMEQIELVDNKTLKVSNSRITPQVGDVFKIGDVFVYVSETANKNLVFKSLYDEPVKIGDIYEYPVSPYYLGFGLSFFSNTYDVAYVFNYLPIGSMISAGGEYLSNARIIYGYVAYHGRFSRFDYEVGPHLRSYEDIEGGVTFSLWYNVEPKILLKFSTHYTISKDFNLSYGIFVGYRY